MALDSVTNNLSLYHHTLFLRASVVGGPCSGLYMCVWMLLETLKLWKRRLAVVLKRGWHSIPRNGIQIFPDLLETARYATSQDFAVLSEPKLSASLTAPRTIKFPLFFSCCEDSSRL